MSSSSASVSVTASPASARSVASSATKIPATVVCRPDPATTTDSAPLDPAARDRAREAAEVEVGTVDPLDGQAEGRGATVVLDFDALEILHEMGALEPRRARALRTHVVAEAGRERNREQRAETERFGETPVGDGDVAERLFVIADEVDLVHREHDVANAEQRGDDRMAVRLRSADPCARRPARWPDRRWRRRSPCCGYIARGRACPRQ